jgi:hypothetical protein
VTDEYGGAIYASAFSESVIITTCFSYCSSDDSFHCTLISCDNAFNSFTNSAVLFCPTDSTVFFSVCAKGFVELSVNNFSNCKLGNYFLYITDTRTTPTDINHNTITSIVGDQPIVPYGISASSIHPFRFVQWNIIENGDSTKSYLLGTYYSDLTCRRCIFNKNLHQNIHVNVASSTFANSGSFYFGNGFASPANAATSKAMYIIDHLVEGNCNPLSTEVTLHK